MSASAADEISKEEWLAIVGVALRSTFSFSNDTWSLMRSEATRAGADASVFDKRRITLQRMIGSFIEIRDWFGVDGGAAKLKANRNCLEALRTLQTNLPLTGMKGGLLATDVDLDQLIENMESITNLGVQPRVKSRNFIILCLVSVWHRSLGLPLTTGRPTHLGRFVEAACNDIFDPRSDSISPGAIYEEIRNIRDSLKAAGMIKTGHV